MVRVHVGQCVPSSTASLAETGFQLVSFHFPGLAKSVDGVSDPDEDIAEFGVEGGALSELSKEVVDLVEFVDNFFKLLLALLVSFVPLVEGG